MPVPSPRNSIRIARGNIADLQSNVGAFGEGEIIYAIDEDRFYTSSSGALFPVGAGVIAASSIDALADVDTTTIAPGVGSVLKWDGTNWVPSTDEAPVTSVAGKTGDVVLVKADITDFSDGDYATAAQGLLADSAVQRAGDTMTGALTLPSGTEAAPALGVGSADNGIYSPGADQVAISTNGTGRVFIDSSGRVGVGTSSASSYYVNNFVIGAAPEGGLTFANNATTGANYIMFADGTTGNESFRGQIVYDHTNDAMYFATAAAERLRITSDGKVGVGTSAPTNAMLHVSSAVSSAAIKSEDTASTGSFLRILGDAASQNLINWKTGTALRFASSDDNYGSFAERVRIDSSGRVGVGTSSPVGKLAVGNASNNFLVSIDSTASYAEIQAYNAPLYINRQGNNTILNSGGGNVGVGISTPQATFHTNGAILSSSSLAALSASNIFIDQPTSALSRIGAVGADDSTAGTLRISQYSSAGAIGRDVLSIDSTGNVGVGTTSPGHSLDVVSTSTAVAEFNGPANAAVEFKGSGFVEGKIQCGGEFIIGSTNNYPVAFVANNTERARIDSSGRLGVGTSSPQAITQIRHASTAPSLSTNTGAGLAVDGTSSVQLNLGTYPTSPYAAWIQARDTGVDTAYPVVINPLGGNVGVGTTSPVFKFDVSGGAGNGIRYTNATNSVAGIIGADSSTAQYGSTTSHPVAFLVGSVERARIDTSGRLGIGTTSPAAALHINGSFGSSTTANALSIRNGSASSAANIAQIDFWCANTFGGNEAVAAIQALNPNASGNNSGALVLAVSSYGTATTPSERARIDSSGRLLVGTSTSRNVGTFVGARLQVEHQGSLGHTGLSVVDTADTATVSFGANNSGTVCANNKHLAEISFAGNDGTDLQSKAASINVYADGTWGNDDTPGRLVFSTTADGASSPTERMRIKSNGTINFSSVATYADNTAAKAGGLVDGDVYRTATGQLMIVFT